MKPTEELLKQEIESLKSQLAEARAELERLNLENRSLCHCQSGESRALNRLEQVSSDLTRLRAVADGLAISISVYLETLGEYLKTGSDEVKARADKATVVLDEQLARYHAATNPAAVAANTGVIHRTE